MTKDEALKLALEAMTYADACLKKQLTTKDKHEYAQDLLLEAGAAIKEALAQPEQEPVALQRDVIVVNLVREGINKHRARELAEHFSKYTTPPQHKPLTDEEIRKANHHMVDGAYDYSFKQGVKWAEYKHGIKGEA